MYTIKTISESRRKWMLNLFEYHAKYNTNNRQYQVWQQHNHPVELISPKWILQKINYIHLNPVRAGIVEDASHYLYSSASFYQNQTGKLNVSILDLGVTEGYIFMG